MKGKNACWVPGTDHASIATEAKVVAMLKEQGINKSDLSREEFLKYAWDWKEKYGGIILEQLKKLGASCDWNRTRFTMEPDLYDAVIDVFIDLFNKGYIYRGTRMVNWDPVGLTAISDEEVYYKELQSKLYHVQYQIEDTDEYITIATTRPETILGDTAVCVHPDDERYKHLIGRTVIIPIVNRKAPIIADEYVTREFGTGALKVTPAHDENDYILGQKHKLQSIDIFNPDGTLNEKAEHYIGEDRFTVRKKISKQLEELGAIVKIEDIKNKVGYSERTHAVIEPKISMQWFLKMERLSKPALDNVLNENIHLIPDKFLNTYRHWMENVRDWCISRQLWWGQRIPAWYDTKGNYIVAKTKLEAEELYKEKFGANSESLSQDEDVLDTWFSSWLWPISVFDGFKDPNNADIKYYYPTNDLITAPEILFFWVARMIIAGYEYKGEKPFTNVYLTGIVRDKQGRKMSKSLGNSPEPLELIAKYSADGVRVGMLFSSPAGNDLLFDEGLCEQGRNFANKLWNSYRLISGWQISDEEQLEQNQVACDWFSNRLQEAIIEIDDQFKKYRLSDALMAVYKLIWDDYCNWFLEMIKPDDKSIDRLTHQKLIGFFETLLKITHPFMPFITEELWHSIKERGERECIIVSNYPNAEAPSIVALENMQEVLDVIGGIRNIRQANGISNKELLEVDIQSNGKVSFVKYEQLIKKLCNLSAVNYQQSDLKDKIAFVSRHAEVYVHVGHLLDSEKEVEKTKEEINYLKGFLVSVEKKLSNENFVKNAKPEIVESERKKQTDAIQKIKLLEDRLSAL